LSKSIVCIIDSDKITPFCDASAKARKLEEITRTTDWKFVKLIVLDCHEIENILHPKLILELRSGAQYRSTNIINRLVSLETDLFGENSLWRFLDLKGGLNNKKLAEVNGEREEWLLKKVRLLGLNEESFVIYGFGDNVISNLNDNVDKKRLLKNYVLNNPSWNSAFREMFEDIAWRFVGRTPIYT
jgi:hypothetical protein